MSLDRWRAISAHLPPDAIPSRPDFGTHYPWRDVALHARSRELVRRVERARRDLDLALAQDVPGGWRLGLSGGKDSSALAALCAAHGAILPAMSVKDDLDYPGEVEALRALADRTGHALSILTPPVSLLGYLQTTRPSLIADLHGRTADLSARWFYGLLDQHRTQEGYGGVLLGLRAEESRGRRLNHATRGAVYQRADGLHVAQPLGSWTALDVHAYLWREGIPVLPVYLCVDPGADALALRKSWWVCGGGPARNGAHYAWLRRWWSNLWRLAVEIDPEVATLS